MNNNVNINIALPKDFSLSKNLVYLSRSPDECLHKVDGDKVYKLLRLDDLLILFTVGQNRSTLEIQPVDFALTDKQKVEAGKYFSDWFDISTDLTPFYKFTKTDAAIKKLEVLY